MSRVVLATHNAKKLRELQEIMAAAAPEVEVVGLDDVASYPEPAETERTFEGNSLIKSRAAVAATGLPALADDSGLCVDVLNGMPGVRSARWSGSQPTDEKNLQLLLDQVADVPEGARAAQFVCVMSLVLPDGTEHVVRGEMPGRLTFAPRGANGFGYDPIFAADGFDVTTAEMAPADKHAISHRGKAVRGMVEVIRGLLADGKL